MSQGLPKAKTYRERAKECRELARISAEDMKAGFLRLAKAYEALANETEKPPTDKLR
jgi:hypothetical protein